MKKISNYEVQNIDVYLEDERESVEGVLIHNTDEQFKDGDCIICNYREDDFETGQDIEDALFNNYSESDFRIDKCGTYHIGEMSENDWAAIVEECFEDWAEQNDSVRDTTLGDLQEWFKANRGTDPIAYMTNMQLEALAQAILRKCKDYGLVYAIQRESWEPWDDCYESYEDALKEAEWKDCDIIAVIDISKKDPFCIKELHRGEDF